MTSYEVSCAIRFVLTGLQGRLSYNLTCRIIDHRVSLSLIKSSLASNNNHTRVLTSILLLGPEEHRNITAQRIKILWLKVIAAVGDERRGGVSVNGAGG